MTSPSLEIEERQMRLDLIALHSVQPLGIDEREVVLHLQHIDDVHRGLKILVVMITDDIDSSIAMRSGSLGS